MQSYTTAMTYAIATNRRRVDVPASGRGRNPSYGSILTRASTKPDAVHSTKLVQVQRDFHLDTFFNPVWMSGPHVFSFSKDGTIVHPKNERKEEPPHCVGPRVGRLAPGSSSAFASTSRVAKGRVADKPWKNVAITEQDDVEFAAMQAEAKGKMSGLVYTWPPEPQPVPCKACKVLGFPRRKVGRWEGMSPRIGRSANRSMDEDSVPELSYGTSGESESESEVLRVVPERRNVGSKSVGRGWTWQKALEPSSVVGKRESIWTRYGTAREVGNEVVNPLTTEVWVEDELTTKLKEVLRMPDLCNPTTYYN